MTMSECSFGTIRRSEEHTSELQSLRHLGCRLLLEKNKVSMPGRSCSLGLHRATCTSMAWPDRHVGGVEICQTRPATSPLILRTPRCRMHPTRGTETLASIPSTGGSFLQSGGRLR